MIGVQARDTVKPVDIQCTTKERRPLGDIDVNRSHHKIVPTKGGQHSAGKGHIASGFQVFADGETTYKKKDCMKISAKLATTLNDAKKKVVSGKRPFQFIDDVPSGKQLVANSAGVAMKKAEFAVCNSGVLANAVKAADTDRLATQLAVMSFEKMPNKTPHQIAGTDSQAIQEITKDASNTIVQSKEIDLISQNDEGMCTILQNATQTQEPTSGTDSNSTGAIRKVIPAMMDSECTMPTFQLNVQAKEWNAPTANASNGTPIDNDTLFGSTESSSVVRKLSSFWNLCLDDVPQTKHNGNTAGAYRNHGLPSTAQPRFGRKIVGRQLTPFEKRQPPMNRDIMRELDDRSQEIQRYERNMASRRMKATEAMRVEQERLNWSAQSSAAEQQLHQNVPTNMKNQCQPAVIARATANHASTHIVPGTYGFQRTNSIIFSSLATQVPSPLLAKEKPALPIHSKICIMKYPTPPNVPIRYEPADILKLNYTAAKYTDKRVKKSQERARK